MGISKTEAKKRDLEDDAEALKVKIDEAPCADSDEGLTTAVQNAYGGTDDYWCHNNLELCSSSDTTIMEIHCALTCGKCQDNLQIPEVPHVHFAPWASSVTLLAHRAAV